MPPVHAHDCDGCKYLGTIAGADDDCGPIDLYFCGGPASSLTGGTYLARYGSDGPEYTSCALDIIRTNPHLHTRTWIKEIAARNGDTL